MEDRGPDSDQGNGGQDREEARGRGKQEESCKGESHTDGQRIGLGVGVGVDPDQGLEERGRDLEGCGDHADLTEIEMIRGLEDRIHGGHDGLHHVVEEVAEADSGEDAEGGGPCVVREARGEGGGGHSFLIVRLTPAEADAAS